MDHNAMRPSSHRRLMAAAHHALGRAVSHLMRLVPNSPFVQGEPFASPFVQGETFASPFVQGETFASPFVQGETFASPFVQGETFASPFVQGETAAGSEFPASGRRDASVKEKETPSISPLDKGEQKRGERQRRAVIWCGACFAGMTLMLALAAPAARGAQPKNQAAGGVGGLIKKLFSAPAKPTVPEMTSHATDQATRRRLAEARRLIEEDRGGPALSLLQSVLDEPENSYVELDDGRWLSVAEATERQIIESGPDFVAEYRRHYEDQAAAILRKALTRNDPVSVAQVVRRFFLTRSGFEAANHLASFHLDVGQPGLAVHLLDRLLACPIHRDEVTDVMRAKRAAALVLVGQQEPARFAVDAIGQPRLRLGGESRRLDRVLGAAGDLNRRSRAGAPEAEVDELVPLLSPTWAHPMTEIDELEKSLESILEMNANGGRLTVTESRPLVVGDVVLFRDFRGVWAFDSRSGKKRWYVRSHIVTDEPPRTSPQVRHGSLSPWLLYFSLVANGVHGTLTTDGERVFFVDDLTLNPQMPAGPTSLVAVDIATGETAWSLKPPKGVGADRELEPAYYYGPPLALDGKLYLLGESRSEIRLFCVEATSGAQLWSQPIATAEFRVDNDSFRRSQLATPIAAKGLLLCQTNLFRIAAFDPVSQEVLWHHAHSEDSIHRGRRSHTGAMLPPPSTGAATDGPLVVDDSVIVTAPTGKSVRCLDLYTGELRWRIERKDDIFVAGSWKKLLVLAGRNYLRAIGIEDGKQQWVVELPRLSGRGAFVGGDYLVPLYDGRIATVELAKGVQREFSSGRGRPPLGNLVVSSHGLLATGIQGLETLPWRHDVDRDVSERLARNINDPDGLLWRAHLRLADDKASLAVRDLFQALESGIVSSAQLAARSILFDIAGKEALADADVAALLVDRLLPYTASAADEGIYYRLLAEFHRLHGNDHEALDAVEHHKLLPLDRPIVEADKDLGRSQRTWVRAFLKRLHDGADVARRQQIQDRLGSVLLRELDRGERPIRDSGTDLSHLPALADQLGGDLDDGLGLFANTSRDDAAPRGLGGEIEPIKQLAFELAGLPMGDQASLMLADRLAKRGAWTEAEQYYLEAAASEDKWLAAEAVASLAEIAEEHGHIEDARHFQQMLASRYPEIPLGDGSSGAQMHATFLQRHRDQPPKRLDWGEFSGARLTVTKKTRAMRAHRFLGTQETTLPFYDDRHFQFDLNKYQLNVLDRRTGETHWQAKIDMPRVVNWNNNTIECESTGHLFFFSISPKIYAFSGLEKKQLWSRVATIGSRPNEKEDKDRRRTQSWFAPNSSSRPPIPVLGPSGPGFLCIRSGKELIVVDSLTGEDLWYRKDLPDGVTVFGDEEVLFIMARDGSATVYSTRDGTVLRRDEKDRRLVSRRDFHGRHMLLTTSTADHLEVQLWDPWLREEVWSHQFPRTSRYFLGREHFLAVLAPEGKLTVLDRHSGELILEDRLEKDDLRKVRVINVFSDDDHYYVAHDFRFGNHVRYMHPTANLEVATVNGPLRAYDKKDGTRLWDRKLEGRTVIVGPRVDLPILFVFESRIKEHPGGTRQLATRVEILSKKDGSTLADKEYDEYTSFGELAHDAAKRWMELRSWNVTVRVDLLSGEMAKQEKRVEAARGWIDSIKQLGDLFQKPPTMKPESGKEPKP
ncbi:outer membrane biogenesis protein BamB [Planctomycetes bacterium Pan216]|uniref:Outer membrane biogenesis protein BamB n=1 Tax=Kolteria novifilia TaxID=2527975 RepID=A0A518BCT5_9BACT|nr:outer membrane biogenesis protein BamB [Planctomycetes bacterium Pan216]